MQTEIERGLKGEEPRPLPKEHRFSDGESCFACGHRYVVVFKDEISDLDKLHDHSNHVLIWQKSQAACM